MLAKTDLARFRATGFEKELDKLTLSLSRALPEAARSWGLARKAANVFLFQTVQNASREDHGRYQSRAAEIALARKHARVCLVLELWNGSAAP